MELLSNETKLSLDEIRTDVEWKFDKKSTNVRWKFDKSPMDVRQKSDKSRTDVDRIGQRCDDWWLQQRYDAMAGDCGNAATQVL